MKTVRLVCGLLLCAGLIGLIVGGGVFYARMRTAYRRTKIEPRPTFRLSAFTELPDRERLRLCAMRGLSAVWPENTLEAIRAAGEAGFPLVQMDVAVTRDEKLVLLYDDTLDRMAGRHERVSSLTFDALKTIPLRNGANVDKTEDAHIPLLTDALSICQEFGMRPVLAVRSAACARLLSALPELQGSDWICVSAQKSALAALRSLPIRRFYRTDVVSEDAIRYAQKERCGIVFDARDGGNTDALLQKALRLPLWAWNADRRLTLHHLAQLGVYDVGTSCILPMRSK